jgi:hypothetical protein
MTYFLEVENYSISEDQRLLVSYDEHHYGFSELIGEGWAIQSLENTREYNRFGNEDEHRANIHRLVDAFHYYNHEQNYQSLRKRAVELYFSLAGLVAKVTYLVGSSQGERFQVVVYADKETSDYLKEVGNDQPALASVAEEAEAWVNGNVYIIHNQTKTVWTAPDGRTMETWDITDSVGGNLIIDLTETEVKAIALDNGYIEVEKDK